MSNILAVALVLFAIFALGGDAADARVRDGSWTVLLLAVYAFIADLGRMARERKS